MAPRPFTVVTCPQRTPEWYAARLGRLTGSAAADMLSTIKTGEAAARRDLRIRLVCERLTQQPQEDVFVSPAMQWGIDMEPAAIEAYENLTGQIVKPVGFVSSNGVLAGCSPDGVVGGFDGLVSIKCPKTATHLGYLRDNRVPPAYLPQVLCELWVTGADWCDFLSFDPRLPDNLRVFFVRYVRDEAAIAEFERKALAFLAEVDTECAALRTLANPSAVLAQAVTA